MLISEFISNLNPNQVTVADLEVGKFNPVILIDVRSPEEYARDRIWQSISVPLEDIQEGDGIEKVQAIAQANSDPNHPKPMIILYCAIFPGAMRAYRRLQKTGLNLAVLHGGMTAWRQAFPAAWDAEILTPIASPLLPSYLSA